MFETTSVFIMSIFGEGNGHAVCISYSGKARLWCLVDSNELPAKYFANAEELFGHIMAYFNEPSKEYYADLYSHKDDAEIFIDFFSKWTNQKSWQGISPKFYLARKAKHFDLFKNHLEVYIDSEMDCGISVTAANAIILQQWENYQKQLAAIFTTPFKLFNQSFIDKRFGQGSWDAIKKLMEDIYITSDLQKPKQIQSKFSNMSHIATFENFYKKNRLKKQFDSFSQLIHSENMSETTSVFIMEIEGGWSFRLCISYSGKTKLWCLVDANEYPAKYFADAEELFEHILADVDEPLIAYMASLYSHKDDVEIFKDFFSKWTSQKSWYETPELRVQRTHKLSYPEHRQLFISVLKADDISLIKNCLDNGLDPNLLDENMSTPFYLAASFANPEILRLFTKYGANFKDLSIVYATIYRNIENLKALIELGIDVNCQEKGDTALHYAVKINERDAIRILLENGANPYIKDDLAKSPLDYASPQIKELIKEYKKPNLTIFAQKADRQAKRSNEEEVLQENPRKVCRA